MTRTPLFQRILDCLKCRSIHKGGIGYEVFECTNKAVRYRSTADHLHWDSLYYPSTGCPETTRRAQAPRRPANLQDDMLHDPFFLRGEQET